MPRLAGKVKWFNDVKGYGFITRDDGEKDVFVHFSAIANAKGRATLAPDQAVTFELVETTKGTAAHDVRPS